MWNRGIISFPQQANNLLKQRRMDVNATSLRRIEVDTTLFRRRVPDGSLLADVDEGSGQN